MTFAEALRKQNVAKPEAIAKHILAVGGCKPERYYSVMYFAAALLPFFSVF